MNRNYYSEKMMDVFNECVDAIINMIDSTNIFAFENAIKVHVEDFPSNIRPITVNGLKVDGIYLYLLNGNDEIPVEDMVDMWDITHIYACVVDNLKR